MSTTVTIKECGGKYQIFPSYKPKKKTIQNYMDEWDVSREKAMINLAIRKQYGRRAAFMRDNGLADAGIYGQVGYPAGKGQGNCLSMLPGRIRIEIE